MLPGTRGASRLGGRILLLSHLLGERNVSSAAAALPAPGEEGSGSRSLWSWSSGQLQGSVLAQSPSRGTSDTSVSPKHLVFHQALVSQTTQVLRRLQKERTDGQLLFPFGESSVQRSTGAVPCH